MREPNVNLSRAAGKQKAGLYLMLPMQRNSRRYPVMRREEQSMALQKAKRHAKGAKAVTKMQQTETTPVWSLTSLG